MLLVGKKKMAALQALISCAVYNYLHTVDIDLLLDPFSLEFTLTSTAPSLNSVTHPGTSLL